MASIPLPVFGVINTTIFVSSLPFSATTTDLLTHFSFLGPVRHGFIATDKTTGKSKGVGYVTYSLKEDAETAVKELDGSEFGDKGRKIRVEWADKRPPPKERAAKEISGAKARAARPVIESTDPAAIRTLVLTGLPKELEKNVLWKKVRKTDERIQLEHPVEGAVDTAHLVFPSHADALKAIPKLHGHTYKGSILSCVLKKRLEKLGKTSHAGRLIVRNLSWDTTEQDLRATFLPYGPIQSIDLPTLPSKLPSNPDKAPPPPRARGFAFVWFLSKADAERAIQGVNGKIIAKAGGQVKGKINDGEKEARKVAVDWALSKEKWDEAQKTADPEKAEAEDNQGSASDSSDGDAEEESGFEGESGDGEEDDDDDEDDDSEGENEEDDKDTNDEGEDLGEEEEGESATERKLPKVDVGSTLFIRNLPFEVTEQELNTLFRSFGPLRYAKITLDKTTGRSRGTGFVCFWKTEHADKALEEAEKVAQETGTNAIPVRDKNPFSLPSVLTADPSSSLASRLVLHGRTLELSRAVTREEAGQIKEDGERARHQGDKRNTYLMREGVLFPNSPAAATLPAAELEKRQASFNARKALLRSNPSLYISKTRLSIRQLPLFATDRTLKRLAIHAVRTFDTEVASSSRAPLSRTEESDESLSPALAAREANMDKEKAKGKGKGERQTPVIQSKIVRQTDKLDPITEKGRSKGYGFLEMRSHKDALKVLRWANNNLEAGPLMAAWWKEELVELVEKAKKGLQEAREEGKGEEAERRVKLLESRAREGESGGMRGGKTLLIEFSVENVQVVKRRVDKIAVARDSTQPMKRPREEDESHPVKRSKDHSGSRLVRKPASGTSEDERSTVLEKSGKGGKNKKRKRGSESKTVEKRRNNEEGDGGLEKNRDSKGGEREKKGLEKLGANLGSLIGRKRRQRAGK
ncbi:hypothetical protein M231_00555 [Tremella mesenterica]|uniref:RRM domain-containing protein n=1 Tax=Tremella mesenterica TaxID=5217 RepID=A0A4V1M506_TREME|nr:hypothetical protein M231_00555 [Tremella mesenterica]